MFHADLQRLHSQPEIGYFNVFILMRSWIEPQPIAPQADALQISHTRLIGPVHYLDTF